VFRDIRWGVWVVMEAANPYVARCFREYGLTTDRTGRYACAYKKWHLIGLELAPSIVSAAVRREPTGCPTAFRADAVATAKRDLAPGEILDGEGGYTVAAKLLPAEDSVRRQAIPIGLAREVRVKSAIKRGETVAWPQVAAAPQTAALELRRKMERLFAAQAPVAAE
jgi:predicted homoserine dehydrogenase-like protein